MKPKVKPTICKNYQRWESSYEGIVAKRLYRDHLKRMKAIRSCLDNKPRPIVSPLICMSQKLRHDAETSSRINRENSTILQKIFYAHQCFNTESISYRAPPVRELRRKTSSRMMHAKKRLEEIERNNNTLGCKILTTKSTLNTRKGLAAYAEELRKKETFEISQRTRSSYGHILKPEERDLLGPLLRPKIYFDIEMKNSFPLGRVMIQLFTEACPDVVLEFVRLCKRQQLEIFKFIRVFSRLWIEAELMFVEPTLKKGGFVYDMNIIDHGCGIGILSFSQDYLNGFTNGLINFTISLKPMSVLNGYRIPFGRVTRGQRVIECIEDYGTKNGTMKKEIQMTNCGIFY